LKKGVIGLVLNKVPEYSETFFVNKINCLQNEGFDIVIFAAKNRQKVSDDWNVVTPYFLSDNKIARSIALPFVIFFLILKSPLVVKRFIALERSDGYSWKIILENLFINAHILSEKLDWLHFGFATTALRRENVGAAMRVKTAVSFRGYDIAVYPLKHQDCYDLLWKKVDKVHSISNDLFERAYKLGLQKDIASVKITPAIDVNHFAKKNTKTVSNSINILTISRLTWIKGLSYSIYAMYLLKQKGVDFRYTIVGDGDDRGNLFFMIEDLGLKENVFLAGKLNSEKIKSLFSDNEIYLQPSVHEGFCNASLEAQAAGLLCIVTDGGGLKESVVDLHTGWVVPVRNPAAIADAILNVHKLPEQDKQEIIYNARVRVENEFNLETQTKQFVDFYS